jgi:hypothetical protein
VPGRVSTEIASWFAIVPLAVNSAASFPRRSAASSSSRLTVGSSRYTSSPTGARAIAMRISGVGVVTVSDRRSTRPSGDGIATSPTRATAAGA